MATACMLQAAYEQAQGGCVPSTSSGQSTTLSPTASSASLDEDGRTASLMGPSLCPRMPPLHTFLDFKKVQWWETGRFRMERKIQNAPRNKGWVDHMVDMHTGEHVAVKNVPTDWICTCHEAFMKEHPNETESPWVDIGCTILLTSAMYPYVCPIVGVFCDQSHFRIASELATEGDLFEWCADCKETPGPAREALIRPIVRQMMDAVRLLHDFSIVHRDISVENILITRGPGCGNGGDAYRVQLIDFGMATRKRYISGGIYGKPAYQAPEAHDGELVDGFLSDAFAVGVVLCCMLAREIPWWCTEPGGCKAFGYFQRRGFRAFAARRKCFGQAWNMAECMSEPVMQLLEGLLAVQLADRLTLGECAFFQPDGSERRSVWDEPWVHGLS